MYAHSRFALRFIIVVWIAMMYFFSVIEFKVLTWVESQSKNTISSPITWTYFQLQFPVTPGHEFSGEILEVGCDNVNNIYAGDKIVAMNGMFQC